MKNILLIAMTLMVAAGIYGATDMVLDLRSKSLIEYEHVRDRHARNLVMIIKTVGLKHTRRGTSSTNTERRNASLTDNKVAKAMPDEVSSGAGHTSVAVMEIFSRGDIESTLEVIATEEDEARAAEEAARHSIAVNDDEVSSQNSAVHIERK